MNSKTPWTPGPWHVRNMWVTDETELVTICRLACYSEFEAASNKALFAGQIKNEANARLIAAAPEMAEFVKSVFLWDLSKTIGRNKPAPLYPHIVEQAKALLAKLEGGKA